MIPTELLNAYKWHRQAGHRAKFALEHAKIDELKGTRRYPSSSIHNVCRQSDPNYAWIEDPAAVGLRFVGWSDELVRSISHQGWYTDDDFQDSTIRGGVWQFPARGGCPVYVAGYVSSDTPEAAFVCLDLIEGDAGARLQDDKGARDAAMQADSMAENAAERERDYRAANSARNQYEELADEIAATRKDLLAVLGERRIAKSRDPEGVPALCNLIRRSVQRGLQDIADNRKKRSELLANYSRRVGWSDY